MSCSKCEDIPEGSVIETYVRIGRANVMIVGCEEHLAELIRLLRVATESEEQESA